MNKEPRRNDECPCGSGKKYKRCCMIKRNNQAELQAKRLEEANRILGKI